MAADRATMILGIDAFNISSGGGLTHLQQILRGAQPSLSGFEKVVIWSSAATLRQLPDKEWLQKRADPALDGGLLSRALWHRFKSRKLAVSEACDVVLCPGGTASSGFRPVVTMCRNMLPFEPDERASYGFSLKTLKLSLLRNTQLCSFRKASGIVFLTEYARDVIASLEPAIVEKTALIPHGISGDFFHDRTREKSSPDLVPTLIYVSIVSPYKHHANVVRALQEISDRGLSANLILVGPPDSASRELASAISAFRSDQCSVKYLGAASRTALPAMLEASDIGIFASSCENMPNILLEKMASGLPLACSNKGPMPEILGAAGVFFDPKDPISIADALEILLGDPELRKKLSLAAQERARRFTWEKTARSTFDYLAEIAKHPH